MLSGGQQQRIAVARSLANRPSVILADEPTAALDGQRGRQVMELFAKVAHEQGAGVIVVTHDHRSLDVFDTTYEMEDGILTKLETSSYGTLEMKSVVSSNLLRSRGRNRSIRMESRIEPENNRGSRRHRWHREFDHRAGNGRFDSSATGICRPPIHLRHLSPF